MEPQARQAQVGARMNRKGIIILTTVGIFVVLTALSVLFFRGWPPWPVIFWFAVSHIFFCAVIMRTPPFRGPYQKPMADSELP